MQQEMYDLGIRVFFTSNTNLVCRRSGLLSIDLVLKFFDDNKTNRIENLLIFLLKSKIFFARCSTNLVINSHHVLLRFHQQRNLIFPASMSIRQKMFDERTVNRRISFPRQVHRFDKRRR